MEKFGLPTRAVGPKSNVLNCSSNCFTKSKNTLNKIQNTDNRFDIYILSTNGFRIIGIA